MAKVIDKEPIYQGEKNVWHAFDEKLPKDWVVYNNRSINGREYDFCIMVPNKGLFIIEVKGWSPKHVMLVVDERTIFLTGKEKPEDSPRGQARSYRFELIKKLNEQMGFNPLVMSLVCYPFITKDEYYDKGLHVVSDENETIFKDDLEDAEKLYNKIIDRYEMDKYVKHDDLNEKMFSLLRHYHEPTYDLKEEKEKINPGYSRLRIIIGNLSKENCCEIVDEYFNGIKEIVILNSLESAKSLIDVLESKFNERKLYPTKSSISISTENIKLKYTNNSFNIFNFEMEIIDGLDSFVKNNILIEEGECTNHEEIILKQIEQLSEFNYQQFMIEHAPINENILVKAGAGTGKTYSMVSRIAYLCNNSSDTVVDIANEIAMITFTDEAAINMKKRLKRVFLNYLILTSKEKFMKLIEEIEQMQISTIHKFAIMLLRNDCIKFGLGYNFNVTNEVFYRRELYKYYINEFIIKKVEDDSNFTFQLNTMTYDLQKQLMGFADKLYDRSIDIKALSPDDFDDSIESIPFFNELIFEVIIPAEKEYLDYLTSNNLLNLRESMIKINTLVSMDNSISNTYSYRYIFVDEFQDTDDIQIETIAKLQKIFDNVCKLFIVGDLKQSIYRFRGASLSAFEKIKKFAKSDRWIEFSLNKNYRTDKRLLDLYNIVFKNMGEYDVLPYIEANDRLVSSIEKKNLKNNIIKSVEVHGKDKEEFYKSLFNEVKTQMEIIAELSKDEHLDVNEKTIAILVRYNAQIKEVVKEANKIGLHIKVNEGGDLYKCSSTTDLYKLILAITHPRNKMHLTNLIESNYINASIDFYKLSGKKDNEKLEELIKILNEYFTMCLGKSWSELLMDFETRPSLVVIREIYEATKPWKGYKDIDDQREYMMNFELLLEKMTNKSSHEFITVNHIYESLKINITTDREEQSRRIKKDNNKIEVICTTIHKSKGLEYGTIILPFMDEDISNIRKGGLNINIQNDTITYSLATKRNQIEFSEKFNSELEEKEKIAEEIRVLYVAMTRAIKNLVWFNNIDSCKLECWKNYMEVIENGNSNIYIQ